MLKSTNFHTLASFLPCWLCARVSQTKCLSVGEESLVICVFTNKICRYHPDKNANDVKAGDMFKEVTFSYNILSDPDKRRQYDTAGFEVYLSELSLVFFFNNRILHWIILYIVSNFLYIYFLRLLNQKVKSWNWIFQV